MTSLALSPATVPPGAAPLVRLDADAPVFRRLGLLLAITLAVTLPAMAIDTRLFQGESIWTKPVKFQVALSTYLLTLAWYARFMPAAARRSRGWRAFSAVVAVAILGEMIWISGAAMFGTASHFNVATPAMAAVYSLMGAFAVTLTAASPVMGIAILRHRQGGLPAAMRLGLGLGLILTFILTVPVAGYLASGTGHLVGTPVTGAKVWLMGWSREVGDLRVAHFLATHALHGVPLAALAATAALPERIASGAVVSAAMVYTLLVAFTFWQALNGLPFLP